MWSSRASKSMESSLGNLAQADGDFRPTGAEMNEITELLNNPEDFESRNQEELILALYRELRSLAGRKMVRESAGHTLQPTALVHEVWLRLVLPSRTKWQNRVQFFSAAAEAMRRILIDHARRK